MDLPVFSSDFKERLYNLSKDVLVTATETLEINTAGQLNLEVPLRDENNNVSKLYNILSPNNIILVPYTIERSSEYNAYKITNRTVNEEIVEVTAVDYGYWSLSVDGVIEDYNPGKIEQSRVISELLANTNWLLGGAPDDSWKTQLVTSFWYMSPLECISRVLEHTGSEIQFTVNLSNNRITGSSKRMYLKERIGEDTHKRFEYGARALNIVAEQNVNDLCTVVYPRGKGEEQQHEDTGDTTYGRRITIASQEWKKSNGDPIDKPYGQEWISDGTDNFLLDNGRKPTKVKIFEDIEDAGELLREGWKWLQQNNRPQVQFSATLSDVGDLNLGDRVDIVRSDLDIRYTARVYKVTRNLLNLELSEIELGDKLTSNSNQFLKTESVNSNDIRSQTITADVVQGGVVTGSGLNIDFSTGLMSMKQDGRRISVERGNYMRAIMDRDIVLKGNDKEIQLYGNALWLNAGDGTIQIRKDWGTKTAMLSRDDQSGFAVDGGSAFIKVRGNYYSVEDILRRVGMM